MWFGRIVLLLAWAQLWDGLLFFGSTLVCYILLAIAQGLILLAYIGKSNIYTVVSDMKVSLTCSCHSPGDQDE